MCCRRLSTRPVDKVLDWMRSERWRHFSRRQSRKLNCFSDSAVAAGRRRRLLESVVAGILEEISAGASCLSTARPHANSPKSRQTGAAPVDPCRCRHPHRRHRPIPRRPSRDRNVSDFAGSGVTVIDPWFEERRGMVSRFAKLPIENPRSTAPGALNLEHRFLLCFTDHDWMIMRIVARHRRGA